MKFASAAACFFLSALVLAPLGLKAVQEVPPTPTNRGNWNREEVLDYLERCWTREDVRGLRDWFNSSDTWEAIWVKGIFWRHEDSPFKRKVAVMMLRGSAEAWGDPDPDGIPPVEPMRPEERRATIVGCIEEIHAAAPELELSEKDFQNYTTRSALAERFADRVGLSAMLHPVSTADEEESAKTTPGVAKIAPQSAGSHSQILLVGIGLAIAFAAAAWVRLRQHRRRLTQA